MNHRTYLIVTSVLMLMIYGPAWSQSIFKKVTIEKDPGSLSKIQLHLVFDKVPDLFPIFPMEDENILVVDLPGTRAEGNPAEGVSPVDFVRDLAVEVSTEEEAHTRMLVYVTKPATYTTELKGNKLIVILSTEGPKTAENTLFEGGEPTGDYNHIKKINYKTSKNIFELEIFFSKPPRAPVIYKMDKPTRVVVDLNEVGVDRGYAKEIKPSPVSQIAVVKTQNVIPFTSVMMYLDKSCTFEYLFSKNKIVVKIASVGRDWKKIKKWLYIGSGIALGAGVTTGIIIAGGGDGGGGDAAQDDGDLGTPPALPDQ